MTSGVIAPPLGDLRPVEEIAAALTEMDERRTLGKTVLTF
jgi:D-arabinose 1-dehydrogenase-like Zn-dependent alcohol dehydrogenase